MRLLLLGDSNALRQHVASLHGSENVLLPSGAAAQAPGDKYSGKRFKLHREAGDMLKATGVSPKRAAKATLSAAGWGRK